MVKTNFKYKASKEKDKVIKDSDKDPKVTELVSKLQDQNFYNKDSRQDFVKIVTELALSTDKDAREVIKYMSDSMSKYGEKRVFVYGSVKEQNQFKNYSIQDYENDLKFFSSLSLKELRKRQNLNEIQIGKAYSMKKMDTLDKLNVIDRLLLAAVDIKEFGDTSISEWAKVIYSEFR